MDSFEINKIVAAVLVVFIVILGIGKISDIIFHVGAISDTSLQDVAEMMRYNYSASKKLFDLAQAHHKKIIYSSSAACGWGGNEPSNVYGWSKLLAEDYGMAKCDKFVSLRYFNVYGERQATELSLIHI